MVKKWLDLPENRFCAIYPDLPATQCHHVLGRLGVLKFAKRFWLPVSFKGHRFIHDNPKQSAVLGFLAGRNWNNAPKDDEQIKIRDWMIEKGIC